jgi:hypothetical protein
MQGSVVSSRVTGLAEYDEEVVKSALFIHGYTSFVLRESQ